jgi:hypothetical protein
MRVWSIYVAMLRNSFQRHHCTRWSEADIPERRSHRRDDRRIKEVQFKRDYPRALHGVAGGPCICRSIWRQDGRSFSGWYAPVLVGKWENSGGQIRSQLSPVRDSPCSRRSPASLLRDVVPMFGMFAVAVTPPYRARSSLFITDGIDTKTPAGRFFFHVMASLARWSAS